MVLTGILEAVGVSRSEAMMVVNALLIAGAINWGLVGVADYNLVENLLGTGMLTTVVYGLVGLAGVDRALTALDLY
jgi:uncharacterized membrane protein YuzA (DUF378 family)